MTDKTLSPKRRGLVVGWPIIISFSVFWAIAVAGFVQQARHTISLDLENSNQTDQIGNQQERIVHLEKRLLILEAIENLQTRLSQQEEVQLASDIYETSQKHNLPPLLVVAMIKVESSFGARAISSMGARGLLQVKPSTGRWVASRLGWEWPGDDMLFDPRFNLLLGTQYLAELIERFGSVEKALIAYNWGETAVHNRIVAGVELPYGYMHRVLNAYRELQGLYGPERGRGNASKDTEEAKPLFWDSHAL